MRFVSAVLLSLSPLAHAAVFTVDTTSDALLSACTPAPADCSLRGALSAANATPEFDEIRFQIPASDSGFQPTTQHWRITVGSVALPAISAAVLIDGYTQPGASANTRTPMQGGLDAVLTIELVPGSVAGSQQNGLDTFGNDFAAAASTIRGLVISRFGSQIQLGGSAAHRIEGCFLGTDIRGTQAAVSTPGGRGNGIRVQGPGPYRIGGSQPAERNLLSGLSTAINQFAASDGLRIQGNLIGTDRSGTLALGNTQDALSLQQGVLRNAQIGGTDPLMRNVIAASSFSAISLFASATGALLGTQIEGNYIGTDVGGTQPLGNGGNPGSPSQPQPTISVLGNVDCGLLIGGNAAGQANLIANSAAQGLRNDTCRGVVAADNHYVGNRGVAFDNVAGGGMIGPTPNDAGDPDDGGNRLQNFPELQISAIQPNGDVQLSYRVDTALTNAAYPLELRFYRAGRGGGGVARITQVSYSTPGVPLTLTLTAPALPLTAVSVDAAGNQSEFAPALGDFIAANGFEAPVALLAQRR
ncbi:MAG: hypothetical protein MUE46_09330 [Xanthomonadales bacterium]|jgi:hypothetical protein|nr:hypothetical protein [Xanthomonadales bacterium]